MKQKELRFDFGKNWEAFLQTLNDERIAFAEASLKRALSVEDLRGKTFLDIGCGSGLFSLAAVRLGARVHSFDYDSHSVACTATLKRCYFPHDSNWTVERGSVLDQDYMSSLGTFDVVYSWGVLHHTGNMWQALANVIPLVKKPGGKLFIAIYNDLGTATERWRAIKKLYVSSNFSVRWAILVALFAMIQLKNGASRLLRLQNPNPLPRWRAYKKNRGMSVWRDHVDWVGGYPYETAKPEQIFDFYRKPGFSLEFLQTGSLGCNEFVFSYPQRQSESNSVALETETLRAETVAHG